MKWAVALLALVASVLVACGSSGTPTPIGGAPIDVKTVEHLLTKDDLKAVGASGSGLDDRTEDLSEVVGSADPAQMEGVDAWYSRSLTSDARPGVQMSLRRFTDQTLAFDELDDIEKGALFDYMDEPIGHRSVLAEGSTSEYGPAIAFVEGRTLILLQSPSASDGTALLTVEQIKDLARILVQRL